MLNTYATLVSLVAFAQDRLKSDEKGATAVEYGLMVGLIAVVIIAAVTLLGDRAEGAVHDHQRRAPRLPAARPRPDASRGRPAQRPLRGAAAPRTSTRQPEEVSSDDATHRRRARRHGRGVRLHRAAAHRPRPRHRRVRPRLPGAGHALGRRPRGRPADGPAERPGGRPRGGPERRGLPGPGDHRRPDHDRIVGSTASCPTHRRRQHVGAPHHRLPDALPHRLLRHRASTSPGRGSCDATADRRLRRRLRRRARRHRGRCSPSCSSRCSASRPSPSTSARSTPSAPACRWRPTPRRIAVAQDCSRGNCGDMLATAQALITANDAEGTAAQPVLSSDPLSVTVTGGTPKEHWFAPVIGHDSTAVSATATVGWGSPEPGHRRPAADLLLVLVQGADRRRPPVGHGPADDHLTKGEHGAAAPTRRATSSRVASASSRPTPAPARSPVPSTRR